MENAIANFQMKIAKISRKILSFFFEIEIKGIENIQNLSGPIIIAPMHKTYIDHFFLIAELAKTKSLLPIRTMTRYDFLEKPFLSSFLKKGGAFPNSAMSYRASLRILSGGGVVLIYPEGGTYKEPGIREFRPGLSHLAMQTKVYVLPVAFQGLEHFLVKRMIFNPLTYVRPRKKVSIIFGRLFRNDENFSGEKFSEEIRKRMLFLYTYK